MKPYDTDLLNSSIRGSDYPVKILFFAIVITAIGIVVWIRCSETDTTQKVVTTSRGAELSSEAGAQRANAELPAENERLSAELLTKKQETERHQENERLAKQQREAGWNKLIDQIVIKLERVSQEPENFQSARFRTELNSEETRLKSLVRDQESEARSIAFELKAQEFPKAEELDRLIKRFANQYTYFVRLRRAEWEVLLSTGYISNERSALKYQEGYYEALAGIRNIKIVSEASRDLLP